MKLIYGIWFIVCYIAWLVYRCFIKKDMKQHKSELHAYSFIILVWVVIYAVVGYAFYA